MKEGKIRLRGIATSTAHKGNVVEIEIDLGTTGHVLTALEDEPPHVTLIRVERENELLAQLNAASLSLQRIQNRNRLLEHELTAVTAQDSTFTNELAEAIAGKLMGKVRGLVHNITHGDYVED